MARRSISIEEKIEAQKELVSKAKDRYDMKQNWISLRN